MIERDQIKVLEFNAASATPSAALLMRIKSDIVPIMEAVIDGRLDQCALDIDERAAVCVSWLGRLPGNTPRAFRSRARCRETHEGRGGLPCRHARPEKAVVTTAAAYWGDRLGETVAEAIAKAYQAVDKISWRAYCRRDIAAKPHASVPAPAVGIVMGSDSDLAVMEEAAAMLKKFGVRFEMTVASATAAGAGHEICGRRRERGIKVIIAGAGHAAHLAACWRRIPACDHRCSDRLLQSARTGFAAVHRADAAASRGHHGLGRPVPATPAFSRPNCWPRRPGAGGRIDQFKKDMASDVERKAEKLKDYR